jgi:hypothetical protein
VEGAGQSGTWRGGDREMVAKCKRGEEMRRERKAGEGRERKWGL